MTPTPVPTPSFVVQTVIEQGLQTNYLLVIGSIWAGLLRFVFVSLSGDRQRTQLAFLIIVIASLPVLLINAGWWAITVYFFVLLYRIITSFRSLV